MQALRSSRTYFGSDSRRPDDGVEDYAKENVHEEKVEYRRDRVSEEGVGIAAFFGSLLPSQNLDEVHESGPGDCASSQLTIRSLLKTDDVAMPFSFTIVILPAVWTNRSHGNDQDRAACATINRILQTGNSTDVT